MWFAPNQKPFPPHATTKPNWVLKSTLYGWRLMFGGKSVENHDFGYSIVISHFVEVPLFLRERTGECGCVCCYAISISENRPKGGGASVRTEREVAIKSIFPFIIAFTTKSFYVDHRTRLCPTAHHGLQGDVCTTVLLGRIQLSFTCRDACDVRTERRYIVEERTLYVDRNY